MATYYLTAPLKDEDVMQLQVGDLVYLSGPCFTCRSKLQRYIFDEGHTLPFTPEEQEDILWRNAASLLAL